MFSCSRTTVESLEILVALKLRFIDKRRILIIARTELFANRLLLLGDVLPEPAGLLLQRLHPRRAITEDWIGGNQQRRKQRKNPRTKKKKQGHHSLTTARPRANAKQLESGSGRWRRLTL
uniref:Uncharacterized protein n=1 Tax=Arundo donax TaxID=35708 RepID=A0A0A9EXE4_ARUDO